MDSKELKDECHNLECYFQLNATCSLGDISPMSEEVDMLISFDCPKLKSSPKKRKCDGCNSSHPSDHLLEFEGKYYCCFCFGDIQEEKANWDKK